MPREIYNGIQFDSTLEVDFYKLLQDKKAKFVYQTQYKKNPIHINLGRRKNYTPDFVVCDDLNKTIYIIETKGYAKWSANEDNNIMDFMKNKEQYEPYFLIEWLKSNRLYKSDYAVKYERIKHIKSVGFVPYDFKNPNSIPNQRLRKIKLLEAEIKEHKKYQKECERFFSYCAKISGHKKLTKSQLEWFNKFHLHHITNYMIEDIKKEKI